MKYANENNTICVVSNPGIALETDNETRQCMTEWPGKSLAEWIPPLAALPPVALGQLRAWWHRAQRVYPANTLKAWRCDWLIYGGYCAARDLNPLPASPDTVAGFVVDCKQGGKRPATVWIG
jgi:hypothetical protein